jgi:hypothetical protein
MYTFPAPFVEEAVFFSPLCAFGIFINNQMAAAAWAYFWVFYSTGLYYVTVSMPVLFFWFGFFLPRFASAFWGHLCFHMNFCMAFSSLSVKNVFGILMRIALNL